MRQAFLNFFLLRKVTAINCWELSCRCCFQNIIFRTCIATTDRSVCSFGPECDYLRFDNCEFSGLNGLYLPKSAVDALHLSSPFRAQQCSTQEVSETPLVLPRIKSWTYAAAYDCHGFAGRVSRASLHFYSAESVLLCAKKDMLTGMIIESSWLCFWVFSLLTQHLSTVLYIMSASARWGEKELKLGFAQGENTQLRLKGCLIHSITPPLCGVSVETGYLQMEGQISHTPLPVGDHWGHHSVTTSLNLQPARL